MMVTVANHWLITVIRFVAKNYTRSWRDFANRFYLVLHAYKILFSGDEWNGTKQRPSFLKVSNMATHSNEGSELQVRSCSNVWLLCWIERRQMTWICLAKQSCKLWIYTCKKRIPFPNSELVTELYNPEFLLHIDSVRLAVAGGWCWFVVRKVVLAR